MSINQNEFNAEQLHDAYVMILKAILSEVWSIAAFGRKELNFKTEWVHDNNIMLAKPLYMQKNVIQHYERSTNNIPWS